MQKSLLQCLQETCTDATNDYAHTLYFNVGKRSGYSQRCSLSARASLMATPFCMVRLLSPAPARFSDRLMTRSFDGAGAGA